MFQFVDWVSDRFSPMLGIQALIFVQIQFLFKVLDLLLSMIPWKSSRSLKIVWFSITKIDRMVTQSMKSWKSCKLKICTLGNRLLQSTIGCSWSIALYPAQRMSRWFLCWTVILYPKLSLSLGLIVKFSFFRLIFKMETNKYYDEIENQ